VSQASLESPRHVRGLFCWKFCFFPKERGPAWHLEVEARKVPFSMFREPDFPPTLTLVQRAQSGDGEAFTLLSRRFEEMALGYAFSLLGDFHEAEDAAQEAFVAAFCGIGHLQDAHAFAAWLRGIVRHRCNRLKRRLKVPTVSLDALGEETARDEDPTPPEHAERDELKRRTLETIAALAPPQREVVVLFYLREYSHREIADFLGIAPSQVNNRLHAARKQLKRRFIEMKLVQETLKSRATSGAIAERVGRIIAVRGAVVDAQFAPDERPEVFDALELSLLDGDKVLARVTQRLKNGMVRALAFGTLAVALSVGSSAALAAETDARRVLSDAEVAEAVRHLAEAPAGDRDHVVETGIKALDLLCPLPRHPRIGIFGPGGVGGVVLLEELIERLNARGESASIFYFVRPADAVVAQNITGEKEYPGDVAGQVQTFWLLSERATDPDFPATLDALDVAIFLSPTVFAVNIYPAIDPLRSFSRASDNAIGARPREVAERVRALLRRAGELMSDPVFLELVALRANRQAKRRDEQFAAKRLLQLGAKDRLLVTRARKVARFLSQPFDIAAAYTGIPGATLSREQTVRDFAAILEGEADELPESAFSLSADLDSVLMRATK
jgi:RNA polymerase sigma factor (sigma-70 family)